MKSTQPDAATARLPEVNTLLIAHQDGGLVFRLQQGGFCLSENTITISVETEPVGNVEFPECALLCLEGYPLTGPLRVGDAFEHQGGFEHNSNSRLPRAHAYFCFHALTVFIRCTVQAIKRDSVVFALEALHDDVAYYDKRSKPSPT